MGGLYKINRRADTAYCRVMVLYFHITASVNISIADDCWAMVGPTCQAVHDVCRLAFVALFTVCLVSGFRLLGSGFADLLLGRLFDRVDLIKPI